MKKNISLINVDSSLAQWLLEKLKTAPSEVKGSNEMAQAVRELQSGICSSVLMQMNAEHAVLSGGDVIDCGALSIFPAARKVVRNGKSIGLTPKEFDILLFLARNRGEVFTKEQIYQAVWDGEYLMDDSNIMAFIRKLRRKIEPNPDAPEYIITIWGIGYKFSDEF